MKKVSLTCSVFLLLSIIVFASFAFSCGGGGGGVSAARGGNNAGKGGYGGGSGEVKVFVNGKLAGGSGAGDGSSASEEDAAKASSAKFSEGIMSLDWTTMDFKLWVNGQLYFSQTLNKGDTFAISGLKLGDHVKATGTFTTSDGTQEISGEIPSVQNGSKLSLYVTYKWECDGSNASANKAYYDPSATLSGTYTAETGASLPLLTSLEGRTVKGWVDNNGKSFINIPAGTTGNLSLKIDSGSFGTDPLFNVSGTTISSLTSLGASKTSIEIPVGITDFGTAFQSNSTVKSVVLPSTVTELKARAFKGCSALASISLPNRMTRIGNSAFQDCTSLKSIKIPDGITAINGMTFKGCSSLESVDIPGSVENILVQAFVDCTSLSSLTIPASVTNIGSSVFQSCGSSVGGFTLTMQSATPPSLGANAFSGTYTIKVPASAVDVYKAAWSTYAENIFGY